MARIISMREIINDINSSIFSVDFRDDARCISEIWCKITASKCHYMSYVAKKCKKNAFFSIFLFFAQIILFNRPRTQYK